MDDRLRDRMVQAARLLADDVKKHTSAWSHRIPDATSVFNDSSGIGVVVDGSLAPSASPNEYGDRHPLFGNRDYWYKTPHRPFLEESTAAIADNATDLIASVVDDWTRDAGWEAE